MIMREPHPLDKFKDTPFKRKMASLGKLPTGELRKVFELAKLLADRAEMSPRMAKLIDETGALPEKAASLYDITRSFDHKGVLFDHSRNPPVTGVIISRNSIGNVGLLSVAIHPNSSVPAGASHYIGAQAFEGKSSDEFQPPRIIIDMTRILGGAIEGISLFRYHDIELGSKYLFSRTERERPDSGLHERRLKGALGQWRDISEFRDALARLRSSEEPGEEGRADLAVLDLGFSSRAIDITRAEDSIEHVIGLCEHYAKATVVNQMAIHKEFEELMRRNGITYSRGEMAAELFRKNMPYMHMLGKLAGGALVDPSTAAASMRRRAVETGGDEGDKLLLILSMIDRAAGVTHSADREETLYRIVSLSQEELKAAFRSVLDDFYRNIAGKRFFESFPDFDGAAGQIAGMRFLTKAKFPIAARFWKEEYFG